MKRKKIILLLLIILIICFIFIANAVFKNNRVIGTSLEVYGQPINESTGIINNSYFNINSEGKNAKETTEGINKAIKYASDRGIKYIKLERGTYLINGIGQFYENKGIQLQSNISLDLNGSTIIHEKNNNERYSAITIFECENITICNGVIIGDKEQHEYSGTNSTHEFGYGIEIRGGRNIEINNVEISDFTGDGIIVSEMTAEYSRK